MNFKGQAKRLDDIDLPRIGKRIGVGEQFIANMKLFVETNAKLEAVRLVLAELLAVARDIHTEQVRRK